MRHLIAILTLIISSTCFSKGQVPTENEVKAHMDSILIQYKDRLVSPYIYPWNTSYFRSIEQIDKICDSFDEKDCGFFLEQIKSYKYKKWDKRKLATLGLKIAEKNASGDVWGFSIPLFTKDRQTFIIDFGYGCGNLCGESCTYIYKRENNKWRLWKKINCWVS